MKRRPPSLPPSAFTLGELLTVVAIMLLLLAATLPAIRSLKRGRDLGHTAAEISLFLEQAKAHAMAQNTYVWVGFAAEGADALLVGAIASRTGTATPGPHQTPLGKLLRFESVRLVTAPGTADRAAGRSITQLADTEESPPRFSFPRGGAAVPFQQWVRWNPRGEAALAGNNSPGVVEIGLQTYAGSTLVNPADYAALQISALSGVITLYRP